MMIIRDCEVTGTNSEIIKPWIDSKSSKDFKKYKTLHTGVDLSGEDVISVAAGKVILATDDKVIVQSTDNGGFSYGNMDMLYVDEGDEVERGEYLGTAKKYVHFERLVSTGDTWPVRVGMITLYKVDPMPALETPEYIDDDLAYTAVEMEGEDESWLYDDEYDDQDYEDNPNYDEDDYDDTDYDIGEGDEAVTI